MNNTVKLDKDDVEWAIKKGRAAERWRENHFPGGFYFKKPSIADKLLILLNLGYQILSDWHQLWIEIRAGIWTRLGQR